MKVIYDISVLGLGHINPRARTGVFRVVENLAMELVRHTECEMKFSTTSTYQNLQHSLKYLNDTDGFSEALFSKPRFYDRILSIRSRKNDLIKLIVANEAMSLTKRFQMKLQIKRLIALERSFEFYSDDLIHVKDVKSADIYHSPFYPLPNRFTNKDKKINFLTCYDLIPILFPQYFEPEVRHLMVEILNSMTPETWVLCISASTRNDLLTYMGNKLSPERVIVTELAASSTFYLSTDKLLNRSIRKKHRIPDVPYILSVCTFEPRKNIAQVIKAFSRLIMQENINDLNLVLVGTKGWMFDEIFQEFEDRKDIKDKITITGYVPDEDLAAIYSDALMFVYPSFYEGFGLPPLEAMKCGTPVVTSNTSSLPEVVGDAGITIPPDDLDSLCEAIFSIYKSPILQMEMQQKSLVRATNFSWPRCADETIKAYATSLLI